MVTLTYNGLGRVRPEAPSDPSSIMAANDDLLGRLRSADSAAIRQLRKQKAESQQTFWSRFGVTQSSGSRFETGLPPPRPVLILLELYASGTLEDQDVQPR